MGYGPAVYFEIYKGNIICNGISGIANNAIFSLGTPDSINFNPVTESQGENPTLAVSNIIANNLTGFNFVISYNNLYDSARDKFSPDNMLIRSDFKSHINVVVAKNIQPQK